MSGEAGHDVDALVDLATTHAGSWGDSCHHALAEEVVRLRDMGRQSIDCDHRWSYYQMTPELAAEKDADVLAVCSRCAQVEYRKQRRPK